MNRKTVFITGAASGIGRATALRFAAEGYLVGAYDIDEAGLESLQAEVGSESVHLGRLDVTNSAQWQACLGEFVRTGGGALNVLVNNAGILSAGQFADMPLSDQQRIVRVNVDGVLNGCHTAFPYLRATPRAQVVNIASASAIYGQPELATYSATKFAVRGLTEALELEWRRHDITVLALWPLFVDTGMLAGADTASMRSLRTRLTAEDVANAVWSATRRRPRLPRVHHPVGRQAALTLAAAQIAPTRLIRQINKRLTKS
ncbi:SDR family oxidoreductase [Nocardia salmonicida]|uniref:SDR family oxidoreductase n=1 Tax=Nocardia salmonicida TaxID=53431 RepID=UPI0033E02A0B